MPAAAIATPLPGVGASREPAERRPRPQVLAEQGIWLCYGGGELPGALLDAMTGQALWAPPPSASEPGLRDSADSGSAGHRGDDETVRRRSAAGPSGVGDPGGSVTAGFAQGGVLDGLPPGP